MLRRKLGDRLVDLRPNFALLYSLRGQCIRFGHRLRGGIDLLKLDSVVKFRSAPFDLLFPHPINRDIHHDAIDPGIEGGLATESADRFPSLNKAVLSKIPGILLVMYHVINHSKYPGSVASH